MHFMATIPLEKHRRRTMQRSTLVQLTIGISLAALMVLVAVLPSESLSEKYQAASRLSIKRVIATYTNVSLVVGNSS